MNKTDIIFTSALQQAKLISCKEISPLELVEIYLERIAKIDHKINSYFTVMGESAIAQSQKQTEFLAINNRPLPPLFGLPISIKDLNAVDGFPCNYGVAALKHNIATFDEGIVTKIKQAGGIILGKSATSELGSFPYTEPMGFPPTRNPWNLDYTSGGSSGGAAAGLAAGLCSLAQGSDGGGSIRGPAACCGVVGIKPSRGRVSHAPVGSRISGIATNGSLGRNVADAAFLLDIMSGYITGDPYWLSAPEISFLSASQRLPNKLKIAFSTTIHPIGNADEKTTQAVVNSAKKLADLGHELMELPLDLSGLIDPFIKVWQGGVAAAGIPSELLSPLNQWILSQVGSVGEYLQAVSTLEIITRQIISLFDNFDVLLLPVYMHTPIKIGEWADLSVTETFLNIVNWVAPCPPFNASGQPAISLPVEFDQETGLPLAIQIVGKPGDECTIISLAAQLETVLSLRNYPVID